MRVRGVLVTVVAACGALVSCGDTASEPHSKTGADGDAAVDQAAIDASDGAADAQVDSGDGAAVGTAPARWFAILNYPAPADRNQLFAARIAGGIAEPAVLLSERVKGSGFDADAFRWSPTGTHLAFLADTDVQGRFELYAVAMTGGSPSPKVEISKPWSLPGGVRTYRWSRDGSRLAFVVGDTAPVAIYVADFSGAPPVPVTKDSVQILDPLWGFSADGRWLPFVKTSGALAAFDTTTGTSTTLQAAPPSEVEEYRWAPDESLLVFSRFSQQQQERHLYEVSFLAGQPAAPVVLAPTVGVELSFQWAPSASRVAFKGVDISGAPSFGLFVVDLAAPGSAVAIPDSSQVVLWGWAPDASALWMTSIGASVLAVARDFSGGAATKSSVTGTMTAFIDFTDDDTFPHWWPDSRHLQFLTFANATTWPLVVSDTTDASVEPSVLSGSKSAYQHSVSPDGKWVTFSAGEQELVSVSGGKPKAISLPKSSITSRAHWTSDSSMVAYSSKVGGEWHFLVNDVTSGAATLPSDIAPAAGSTAVVACAVGSWQP